MFVTLDSESNFYGKQTSLLKMDSVTYIFNVFRPFEFSAHYF